MNLHTNFAEAERLLKQVNTRPTRNTMGWMLDACVASLRSGGKILVCGNGGSQCDAEHFAEELTGRLYKNRKALAAMSLSMSLGHMTCVANDYGYDTVFMRSLEAFGKPGDVLICLSTSGKSPSVIKTAQQAVAMGIPVFCFLGAKLPEAHSLHALRLDTDHRDPSGSPDDEIATTSNCVLVPSSNSARIQEIHMFLLHSLAEGIEEALCPEI